MKVFNQSNRIYAASVQILPHRFTEVPDEEAKVLLEKWGHELTTTPGGGPEADPEVVAAKDARIAELEKKNAALQRVLDGSAAEPDETAKEHKTTAKTAKK